MMNNQPILSICIPTFKREYLIDQLVKGIYAQNCDPTLYDICITDNSETDETKDLIERKYSDRPNLHYKKVNCKGFMNSIEALKFGNGKFLKLHNDYSMFTEGSLQKLIETAQKYEAEKPVIFYTLRGKKELQKYSDFISFMNSINYLSTWSTSFTIWKADLDRLLDSGIECNYMYPHTTLLFAQHYKKAYIVDDDRYFVNLQPKKKGGYNLVDNFVRIYLDMVKTDLVNNNVISKATYRKIEHNILRFCAANYVNLKDRENYTFSFDNQKEIIVKQCGKIGYIIFNMFMVVYKLIGIVKKNNS